MILTEANKNLILPAKIMNLTEIIIIHMEGAGSIP